MLFLFNPTQKGSTYVTEFKINSPRLAVEKIKPKKVELDMAGIVRDASCVSIPDNIPDEHLVTLYKSSVEYKIPIKIITKLISIESDWIANNSSHKGARGYGQIMPSTKRYIAKRLKEKVTDDPNQNIRFTVEYLREMLDDADGDMRLALAYYNAGPAKVRKYGPSLTRSYTNAIMRCSK